MQTQSDMFIFMHDRNILLHIKNPILRIVLINLYSVGQQDAF